MQYKNLTTKTKTGTYKSLWILKITISKNKDHYSRVKVQRPILPDPKRSQAVSS